jgi:hypothetical protein
MLRCDGLQTGCPRSQSKPLAVLPRRLAKKEAEGVRRSWVMRGFERGLKGSFARAVHNSEQEEVSMSNSAATHSLKPAVAHSSAQSLTR